MAPSPASAPSLNRLTVGAAAGLVAILGALLSVVWSQSAQSSQVEANSASIDKLECLPVQVARIEEALKAQAEQLNRIEDGMKRRKE